jgi:hypothetical protein
MATLVLSTVGGLFGGQLGNSIGSLFGQQIDDRLFGRGREGPRLTDLAVQTSNYGSSVPAIFGAMRVAGTVIWSTDLIENRNRQSAGKGRPSTIEFSYSVSFAVALSSRPALRIGRIWADGNLLRGAAGDFKSEGQFRFYSGHKDQAIDPLIASAEGADASPAYRGLCYAMFEDLPLGDFGNRIPSLTFELFERDGSVSLCDITAALTGSSSASCQSAETVEGFAAIGENAAAALSPLIDNLPVFVRPGAENLEIFNWPLVAGAAASPMLAASENGRILPRAQTRRDSVATPEHLAIRHHDPARDYQIGAQRSQLSDLGQTAQQIDFPASVTAAAARRLADLQLLRRRRNQSGWTGYAARGAEDWHVGDLFNAPGSDNIWQIAEIEHFGMICKITGQRPATANITPLAGTDAGRNLKQTDMAAGPTHLILVDLPALTNQASTAPIVAVAASGTNSGWRRAALHRQTPTGLQYLGSTAQAAIFGVTENALTAHSPYLVDASNSVFIRLTNHDADLTARDIALSDPAAPLFWLNGEILRAGIIDFEGQGRYRLSSLQRGCFGTEDKIRPHEAASPILLLEAATLRTLINGDVIRGSALMIEAQGIGDDTPVQADITVAANAIVPFAPVHAAAALSPLGNLTASWIRRSRTDHGWHDGVDQPLDEDRELYQADLRAGAATLASWQVSAPTLNISADEIAGLSVNHAAPLSLHVCQIGRFARSAELAVAVTNYAAAPSR